MKIQATIFVASLLGSDVLYKNSDFECLSLLKGTATLMICIFHMKELYEPWILIPVSSKSVEKYVCYGR